MRGLRRFVNVPRELGYNAGMKRESIIQWVVVAMIAAALGAWVNRVYPAVPIAAVFCGVIILGAIADRYLRDFTKP